MMLPVNVKEEFISVLMETGNVSKAARDMGINRMTAYGWREDPDFAERWETALEISRQGLRERVVETATTMGLGKWVQVVDPISGALALDDNFEPILQFQTLDVDPRVLMKFMDKTMRDEVRRVDQRTALAGRLEHQHMETKVVIYSPEGEVIAREDSGVTILD